MLGILEYTSHSDVEAFLRQNRCAEDQLPSQIEEDSKWYVIASKLKGEAQTIVERYYVDTLVLLGETLQTHSGVRKR